MEQLTFDLSASGSTPAKKGRGVRRRIDDLGRECGDCGQYKPWDDFHISRGTAYGHTTTCKPCAIDKSRERSAAKRRERLTLRAKAEAERALLVPVKLCECGCGEATSISPKSNFARGMVKGQPVRFKRGHGRRKSREGWQKPLGSNLKSLYGITYKQYSAMVLAQCGACVICGVVPGEDPETNKKTSRLVVDHDHGTGQVRALLCHACNRMLGQSGDNPTRLLAGADYLKEWAA
jgi:Recombination endonuclease VII